MNLKSHWEDVYVRKGAESVSWFRPHLDRSLEWIEAAKLPRDASIVDVGGGASTLVDDLLDRGYRNVTVVDLSAKALEIAKERLGERAKLVRWIVSDVLELNLPEQSVDFWHDRAVFHFLGEEAQRQRYTQLVTKAMKPSGHVLIATFGLDGPTKCSGLDVQRYSPEGIHSVFGEVFERVSSAEETHRTPWGSEQQFVYCYCKRK